MASEARRHLPVPIPVELLRSDGSCEVEYAVNLSSGGLCLHLRDPIPEGQTLRISFEIPSTGRKFSTGARVVWANRQDEWGPRLRFFEMGILFTELEDEEQAALRDYVAAETA